MIIGSSSVTTKGQLTLPKDIREASGIKEGDRVEVLYDGENILIRAYGTVQEELMGSLAEYAKGKKYSKRLEQKAIDEGMRERWERKLRHD